MSDSCPHEVFHQVQRQFGRIQTETWLTEGAPEAYQMIARETAGFGPASRLLSPAEKRVRMVPSIHGSQG